MWSLAVLVVEMTSADENSLPRFVFELNIKRHLKLTFTFYIRKSVISLFVQVQGANERRPYRTYGMSIIYRLFRLQTVHEGSEQFGYFKFLFKSRHFTI